MSDPAEKKAAPVDPATEPSPEKTARPEPDSPGPERTAAKPATETPQPPAEPITLNGQVQNFANEIKQFITPPTVVSTTRFTRKLTREVSDIDTLAISEIKNYLIADTKLDDGVQALERYGFLLIEGPGKASLREIAIWIGAKMKTSFKVKQILLAESLERNVQVDFEEDIVSLFESGSKGLLIFREPTLKQNADFLNLFEQIREKDLAWSEFDFFSACKKNEVFIIVTTESRQVTAYEGLSEKPFTLSVEAPDREHRIQYLRKKLNALAEQPYVSERQAAFLKQPIDEQASAQLIDGLKYISDIERFVEKLDLLVKIQPDTELTAELLLQQAREVNNLRFWITNTVAKDLKSWSVLLTLALQQNALLNPQEGVSLIAFELFRQHIQRFFDPQPEVVLEAKPWTGVIAESELFERLRLKKFRSREDGPVRVAFAEPYYAAEIWKILVEDFGLTLAQLVPFLLKRLEEGFELDMMGRLLGRIGEIDPNLTLNLIDDWSKREQARYRQAVGFLFQGIFASANRSYIAQCKQKLEADCQSEDLLQFFTAISTCYSIGVIDPEYALACFRTIIDKQLSGPYRELRKLMTKHNWSLKKLTIFSDATLAELIHFLQKNEEIKLKAEAYQKTQVVIDYISLTITDLCIRTEPAVVLKEYQKWLSDPNKTVVSIAAEMLLAESGIFDQLSRRYTIYDEESESYIERSILSLTVIPYQKPRQFTVEFLSGLWDLLPRLEGASQSALENRLVTCIEKWVQEGYGFQKSKASSIQFLVEVYQASAGLRDVVLRSLHAWESQGELKWKTLSTEVKNAIAAVEEKIPAKVLFNVGKLNI